MNKVLVFDLDNTLVHRDKAMLNCIEKLFELHLSSTQRKAIEGQDGEGHSDRLLFCKWLKSFLKISLNENQIWDLIRKNIADFVHLDKDAIQVLNELEKEYEMILLTNGGIGNQKRKIAKTGLNHFFSSERIFISEAIGFKKPDSKIFLWVQDQFDNETSFYMIGDHWENDILGAQKMGWKAIYINANTQHSEKENIKIISSLHSLNKVLNEFE